MGSHVDSEDELNLYEFPCKEKKEDLNLSGLP